MANIYNFEGVLIFLLLFICICAYFKRVPRLKNFFLSEKTGFWGAFYKAGVVGTRLHWAVSLSCLAVAFYLILLK